MTRTLLTALAAMIVASAFASPGILPVRGVHYAAYDLATGQITPSNDPAYFREPAWSACEPSGYYLADTSDHGWVCLDWGDVRYPYTVEAFEFAYATEELSPSRLDAVVMFFAEENGRNSRDRVCLAGFRLSDLPAGGDPFNGWAVRVDLLASGEEFSIVGSDLDLDGQIDFGYSYWFPGNPVATGPIIAGDPNLEGPGMEDAFDALTDPNLQPASFVGTFSFDGAPYAQLYMYMDMLLSDPLHPVDPRCSADIDCGRRPPCDCVVNLADLAQLLSHYGTTSGARWGDGDVEPPQPDGGDGDVDLADLALLLSQYGNDCH